MHLLPKKYQSMQQFVTSLFIISETTNKAPNVVWAFKWTNLPVYVSNSQNATTYNNRSDNIIQLPGASKRWPHLRVEDWTKILWHHAHNKPMLLLFSYRPSNRIGWKSRHNLQEARMLFAAWTRHMKVHRNLNSKNRWNSGQLPQE